uniref:Uncharacterized protein n=1 Tax=mine drainage metagenome TaxID=410659 RepID=E6PW45_9ZZZZ
MCGGAVTRLGHGTWHCPTCPIQLTCVRSSLVLGPVHGRGGVKPAEARRVGKVVNSATSQENAGPLPSFLAPSGGLTQSGRSGGAPSDRRLTRAGDDLAGAQDHHPAFGQRLPMAHAQRHAGQHRQGVNFVVTGAHLQATGLMQLHTRRTATQQMQARRTDAAIGLMAAVRVGEQHVAVAVEKIGRADGAQPRGECRHHVQPSRHAGHAVRCAPQRRELAQQLAEHMLGIGLADRLPTSLQATRLERPARLDVGQIAVVREHMPMTGQLARERLGVGQCHRPARGAAHMGEHQGAVEIVVFQHAREGALHRRQRLAQHMRLGAVEIRRAPAVGIAAPHRGAMGGELGEAQAHASRVGAADGEQLAHDGDLSCAVCGEAGAVHARPQRCNCTEPDTVTPRACTPASIGTACSPMGTAAMARNMGLGAGEAPCRLPMFTSRSV